MEFDPFVLARIQFAANISFHILFSGITIGLAWVLLYFRVRFTLSDDRAWEYAYYVGVYWPVHISARLLHSGAALSGL